MYINIMQIFARVAFRMMDKVWNIECVLQENKIETIQLQCEAIIVV